MPSQPRFNPAIELRRHTEATPWTYRDLDRRQREVAQRLMEDERAPGALLISEVAPVITLGRRTPEADLLASRAELAGRGVDVFAVDRGGFATSHGPGQWVVFTVDRLERLTGDRLGVRRAMDGLLNIALKVGRQYDPSAEIRDGAEMGVWTSRGKFAAVGVHVEKGILLHGLAVNGFRAKTSFAGLRPCGLEPQIDYLLEGRTNDPNEARFLELGHSLREAALSVFWQR